MNVSGSNEEMEMSMESERSGASAPSGLRPFGAEPQASQAEPLVPNADPWGPIEYEEGYPVDEYFPWFTDREPKLDFHRAAHWLLAELPRAAENMVCAYCNVTDAKDDYGDPIKRIEFSTGGWSGCESVLGLISRRFDLRHHMESWKRGGHYVFEIPLHFLERSQDAALAKDRLSALPPQGSGKA
jgi:hypothetical protein